MQPDTITLPELPPRMPLFEFSQPDGTVCKLYADGLHEGLQPHMFLLKSNTANLISWVVSEMSNHNAITRQWCEWLDQALMGQRFRAGRRPKL